MSFRPYNNYIPFPGVLITRSVITENSCDNIDISYNALANLYCLAQESVFSHIILNVLYILLRCFKNSIMPLFCAIVVAEYCLLLSEKMNETLNDVYVIVVFLL